MSGLIMVIGCALLAGCARNTIHGYPRFWPKLVDEPAEMMPAVPCGLAQTRPLAITNALTESTALLRPPAPAVN